MSTITFDTLAYVRKLESAGVPRPQAEAQADAFSAAVSEGVASRQDIVDLRTELREFRTDLDHRIHDLEQRLVIKLGAIMIALGGFLAAIRFFGH